MEKSSSDFGISQVAAFMERLRQAGITPELLDGLDVTTLRRVQRVIRGEGNFLHPHHAHIVDTLSAPFVSPTIQGNMKLKKHIPYGGEGVKRTQGSEGLLILDPEQISFYICPDQHRPSTDSAAHRGPGMTGYNLRGDMESKTLTLLNVSVLMYFYMYPQLLPKFMDEEKWAGKKLFFWNTEYKGKTGRSASSHIPYLRWKRTAAGKILTEAGTKSLYDIFGPNDAAVCYGTMGPAER